MFRSESCVVSFEKILHVITRSADYRKLRWNAINAWYTLIFTCHEHKKSHFSAIKTPPSVTLWRKRNVKVYQTHDTRFSAQALILSSLCTWSYDDGGKKSVFIFCFTLFLKPCIWKWPTFLIKHFSYKLFVQIFYTTKCLRLFVWQQTIRDRVIWRQNLGSSLLGSRKCCLKGNGIFPKMWQTCLEGLEEKFDWTYAFVDLGSV